MADAIHDAARRALAVSPDAPVSFRMAMVGMADAVADAVIDALRALPVEERMEAMGMERVEFGDGKGPNFSCWVEAPYVAPY